MKSGWRYVVMADGVETLITPRTSPTCWTCFCEATLNPGYVGWRRSKSKALWMPEEQVDQRPFVRCCEDRVHAVVLGMSDRAFGLVVFPPIQ